MRSLQYQFVICLLLSFASCALKQEKGTIETFSRADFKEQLTLSGSAKELPGIFRPLRIKVIPEANLLIILESQASEYFASVFSLDSVKFMQRLIKNGYGEGEQLAPMSLQYLASENRLYVFDHLLQSFFYYDVDSIARGSDGKANGMLKNTQQKLVTSTNSKILLNPVVLENTHTVFSVATNLANEPLHLLDMYSDSFHFKYPKGQYPHVTDTFPKYAYREVFLGNISNPQPNVIVYSHYNTDILSVFDTAGNVIASRQGPDQYQPDFKMVNSQGGKTLAPGKNSRLCYMPSVRSMGKSYVTLYSGNLISSRNENGKELLVFSDKLIPEKYYKLDKKIFDFDIDTAKGYVYGLSNENRPHIVVFKM